MEPIATPKLQIFCQLKRHDTGEESHHNPGFGHRHNPYPFK
jgi:hypothetical protein